VRRGAAVRGSGHRRPRTAGGAAAGVRWGLKAAGLNPGTSADLTVASLFVHRLETAGRQVEVPLPCHPERGQGWKRETLAQYKSYIFTCLSGERRKRTLLTEARCAYHLARVLCPPGACCLVNRSDRVPVGRCKQG
jgi:hypothetical protein